MSRKQTKEEYVSDCSETHNSFYSYKDGVYITGKHKIEITCPIHGNFWQVAEVHKAGRGCPKCARKKAQLGNKITQDVFDDRMLKIHPQHDFSEAIYISNNTKVKGICKQHGEFFCRPSDLFLGSHCMACGILKNKERCTSDTREFISKAVVAKDNFYSYPRTEYVNSYTKVVITCPLHGDFLQTPSNHLSGSDCPSCSKSGFKRSKPAYLYILHSGDTTKVGITNRTVSARVRQIINGGSPDFEVHTTFYFKDGGKALDLETKTLRWLREIYQPIAGRFGGSKECFSNVNLQALLNFVTPLATTETE